MSEANESLTGKNPGSKKFLIAGIAAVAVIIVAVVFIMSRKNGEDLTATTIRILNFVGDVKISSGEKELTMREDMQLHNGNRITTAKNGSVDLALDDTKTVGIDVDSAASFEQEGGALSVNLESGSLIFYITEKLADNESLDFNTQTMMVGIRSTSGEEFFNPENQVSKAVATSGVLHIEAVNPNTGGRTSADVPAGNVVQTYFYNYEEGDNSIALHVREATPQDVSPLLMQKIMADPEVREEVVSQTNWSVSEMQQVADSMQVVNAAVVGSDAFADNSNELRENNLNDSLTTSYDSIEEAEASGDPVAQKAAQETVRRQNETEDDQNDTEADADANAADADAALPPVNRVAAPDNQNTNQPANAQTAAPAPAPAIQPPVGGIPLPLPTQTPQPTETPASSSSGGSGSSGGSDSSGSSGSSDSSSGSSDTPAPTPVVQTYSISTDQAENGTVNVSKAQAPEGDTVTIAATPANGYHLTSLNAYSPPSDSSPETYYMRVVYENGLYYYVNDAGEHTGEANISALTFTMPARNVTVTAGFEADTPSAVTSTITVVQQASGGTINVDKTSAAEGETVTITMQASDGFVPTTPTVGPAAGAAGSALEVSGNKGTYTFTMSNFNVQVTGTFDTAYQITTSVSEGSGTGTISTDPSNWVAAGKTVKVKVEPGTESMLSSLIVSESGNTPDSGGGMLLKIYFDSGAGSYYMNDEPITLNDDTLSFTMPSNNVSVSATFTSPAYYTATLGDGCDGVKMLVGGKEIPSGGYIQAGADVNLSYNQQKKYIFIIVEGGAEVITTTGGSSIFTMPSHAVTLKKTGEDNSNP